MSNVIATIAVYLITGATSQLTGATSQLTGATSQLTGATSELTGAASELTGAASELTGAVPELMGAVYLTILLTKIFTFLLLPAHISYSDLISINFCFGDRSYSTTLKFRLHHQTRTSR